MGMSQPPRFRDIVSSTLGLELKQVGHRFGKVNSNVFLSVTLIAFGLKFIG